MVVIFEISEALPELSFEKQEEVENFLKNEMKIGSVEKLENVTKEDLIRNNLLTAAQADRLVNFWHRNAATDNAEAKCCWNWCWGCIGWCTSYCAKD